MHMLRCMYQYSFEDACTNIHLKNAEPETDRNTTAVMRHKMDCDLEYFQRVSWLTFPVEKATSTR